MKNRPISGEKIRTHFQVKKSGPFSDEKIRTHFLVKIDPFSGEKITTHFLVKNQDPFLVKNHDRREIMIVGKFHLTVGKL